METASQKQSDLNLSSLHSKHLKYESNIHYMLNILHIHVINLIYFKVIRDDALFRNRSRLCAAPSGRRGT